MQRILPGPNTLVIEILNIAEISPKDSPRSHTPLLPTIFLLPGFPVHINIHQQICTHQANHTLQDTHPILRTDIHQEILLRSCQVHPSIRLICQETQLDHKIQGAVHMLHPNLQALRLVFEPEAVLVGSPIGLKLEVFIMQRHQAVLNGLRTMIQ